MKNILLLPGILTCLFASFAPAQLIDANDRVRIEVKVDTATDQKDLARTSTDRVTQHKTLNISLSGKAKNPEARVVKWTAYGSNQRTEDVKALETGEAKLALDERGSQAIKTKTITTTYTPDHTEGRALRPRAPGRPRSVQVEGKGMKFMGYRVQVLDGEKVVGEFSDPPGIGAKK